jgi:glycosyltransferase involved in cell wall biosynthesis
MRIAIVTATSAWGGAEAHAVQLARGLDDRRHEVVLVELGHSIFTQAKVRMGNRVQLATINLSVPLESISVGEAYQILRRLRADVSVFEKGELDAGNLGFDIAARWTSKVYIVIEQLLAPKMPAKPLIGFRGKLLPGLGWWWYVIYWHRRARSLAPHKIICVSKSVRDRLYDDYGFPERKMVTIHNGIDPAQFRPEPSWRSSARAAWGIPEDDLVFGAVGRLAPIKRLDRAIELFRRFCSTSSRPDAWLLIVGTGPAGDQLQRTARASGFSHRIKFLGSTEAAWEVYNGIDAFLMTSESEGLPLALVEAMACGCCPVVMSVGGVAEVVRDEKLGWLVPKEDESAFLAAMRAVAALTPEQRSSIAIRGRKVVSESFNSSYQIKKIIDLIESASIAKNNELVHESEDIPAM